MLKRPILWLLPVLAFLLFAAGSPAALAHEGHDHGGSTAHSLAVSRVSATESAQKNAMVEVHAANHRGCDCPGGHCGCSAECRAFCTAGSVVVPADLGLAIFSSRSDFSAARLNSVVGWAQHPEPDPPRPIA